MITDDGRRRFLGTGTVVATGLALGAFSKASLAADPKNRAAVDFITHADSRLDAAAIRKLVAGHTMMGVTYKGGEFLAYFDPAGTVDKMVDTRREAGTWSVANGALAFKFPTLGGGRPFALQIYRHRQAALYKGWSPGEQRWAWFVVEPGRAAELA